MIKRLPTVTFSITSVMAATLLAAVAVRIFFPEHDSSNANFGLEVKRLETQRRAVVFIRLDWALQDFPKTFFYELKNSYCSKYPEVDVYFKVIDCTPVSDHYRPLSEMAGWHAQARFPGESPINGIGQILWIEENRVVAKQDALDFENVNDAVEYTRRLFLGQSIPESLTPNEVSKRQKKTSTGTQHVDE